MGALEVCWLEPPERDARLERSLNALADLAAHTLTLDTPPRSTAPATVADTDVTRLADSLPDPVMVLTPAFDARGQLSDFTIAYTNDRFQDLAGRPATCVERRGLRQTYPAFIRPGAL